ncbi:hypothetical protein VCHA38O209_50276 [Vibrio chagasii]|nr:hypothetical protein VCHA38O209_50276 [Vibrio chagasii]
MSNLQNKWDSLLNPKSGECLVEVRGHTRSPDMSNLAIPSDCENVRELIKSHTTHIYMMFVGNMHIMTKTITPQVNKLGRVKGQPVTHYAMADGVAHNFMPSVPTRTGMDAELEKEKQQIERDRRSEEKREELKKLGFKLS